MGGVNITESQNVRG